MRRLYSPDETRTALRLLERMPPHAVARRLRRSVHSIRKLAQRHNFRIREERIRHADMSIPDVAAALGVHRTLIYTCWMPSGLPVRSMRVMTSRYHSVAADDLIAWLRAGHVYRPSIRPSTPEWQEIVNDIRATLGWLSSRELAAMFGVVPNHIHWLRKHAQFPQPRCGGGSTFPFYFAPADVAAWLRARPQYQTSAARRWLEAQP